MDKLTVFLLVVVLAMALILAFSGSKDNQLGVAIDIPPSATMATSSVSLSGTSATVLNPQSGAYMRTISNLGPDTAYLCFASSTTCTAKSGTAIFASTTKVFSSSDLWRGWITGNTDGVSTLSISEIY